MKKRWFRFFPGDFQGSRRVRAMSLCQKGAYLNLLCFAWDDPDCSVPVKLDELKEAAEWNGTIEDFQKIKKCFVPHPTKPGRLYNPRLYEEWLYCQEKSQSAKDSAAVRWKKKDDTHPLKPASTTTRCSSPGLSSVSEEIQVITDKYFPPVS